MKRITLTLLIGIFLLTACGGTAPTLQPIISSATGYATTTFTAVPPFTQTPIPPTASITPLPTIPTFTPAPTIATITSTVHPLTISVNNIQRLRLIKKISIEDSTSDDSITEITTFRHPEGKNEEYLLAIGYSSGYVRLFNSQNFELLWEFESGPNGIAFSPDGLMLAVANYGSEVRVWNISSGKIAQVLDFPNNRVENVVYADSGKKIIGGSDDGQIGIWDTGSWELIGKTRGWFLNILPPDNTPIASIRRATERQDFINPITGSVLFSLPLALEPPDLESIDDFYQTITTAYSSNGKYFAKGTGLGWIAIWDLENQELVNILYGHKSYRHDGPPDGIYDLAFAPYGYLLASTGIDGTVRLWNVETGKALWVTDFGRSISNLTFSPDGRHLFVGDFDGDVYVFGVSE